MSDAMSGRSYRKFIKGGKLCRVEMEQVRQGRDRSGEEEWAGAAEGAAEAEDVPDPVRAAFVCAPDAGSVCLIKPVFPVHR